jgi:hypothetical protein
MGSASASDVAREAADILVRATRVVGCAVEVVAVAAAASSVCVPLPSCTSAPPLPLLRSWTTTSRPSCTPSRWGASCLTTCARRSRACRGEGDVRGGEGSTCAHPASPHPNPPSPCDPLTRHRRCRSYTLAHAMPELFPIFLTLAFGIPLALPGLLILTIDLLTEQARSGGARVGDGSARAGDAVRLLPQSESPLSPPPPHPSVPSLHTADTRHLAGVRARGGGHHAPPAARH